MNTPTALILAAGIGQRLGDAAGQQPKSLLQFAGMSLLERHLQILQHYHINNVIIVTGYKQVLIEAALTQCKTSQAIRTVINTDYQNGSSISLLTGLEALPDSEVILMDADVLYDHRLIGRLLQVNGNCLLLDRDFEPGDEPVKVCMKAGQLVDFRKQIDKDLDFDLQGESVGFFRFTNSTTGRLADRARHYIRAGALETPYEECIRDLILEAPASFACEDITGLPWIEIDFPEDVARAEREILPLITVPE